MKTITKKLVSVVLDECVSNYADLMDELECQKEYSPIDEFATEYIPYTLEQFIEKTNNKKWFECHDSMGRAVSISNRSKPISYQYKTSDYGYWNYTEVDSKLINSAIVVVNQAPAKDIGVQPI